ncbi:hypothetical protein, partial [Escherichia coli]|uniref:hypothetical protein n=1 Tax=Escherichia coli TaxID=562 RepID=UPI003917D48C
WLMMSLWDALRMNMMISYQELVRTFLSLMSYGMMVICFPTGIVFFIALIFIGTVSDIIGVRIDSKYIMAIIIWLYFLSGGYIQWFVLSKRIINK